MIFSRIRGAYLALLALMCMTAVSSQVSAQAPANLNAPLPLDKAIRTGTLPNGLTFYIRKNTEPEDRAMMRLAVKAGSIDEADDQRGLAHVLEQEPAWDLLPPATPPLVHRLLHRCLEKKPKERLRDIGDARVDLDERSGIAPELPRTGSFGFRRAIALWAAIGVGVTAALAGVIGWVLKPTSIPVISRFSHVLDPRTGNPVEGLLGASVVCATATEADALSTALFVLGREAGAELARRRGAAALLVPAEGAEMANDAFRALETPREGPR